MFVSEVAELNFGILDPQDIAQASCEATLPGPLCKLSLQVASISINLGHWYRQYKKEK
jgi:hypothetical protein